MPVGSVPACRPGGLSKYWSGFGAGFELIDRISGDFSSSDASCLTGFSGFSGRNGGFACQVSHLDYKRLNIDYACRARSRAVLILRVDDRPVVQKKKKKDGAKYFPGSSRKREPSGF